MGATDVTTVPTLSADYQADGQHATPREEETIFDKT